MRISWLAFLILKIIQLQTVYLSHCEEAVRNGDVPLFQQPLKKSRNEIWYSSKRPVGPRSFSTRVLGAFKEAGK